MENFDRERGRYLPQSKKYRGERRVYQYATGRGGVPIGNESPTRDETDVDYQYATGRGGVKLSPEDRRNFARQFDFTQRGEHFGKGPKTWKVTDERIQDQVCEALYRSYDVDASDIDVSVKNGIVTLKGTVDSRDTKRLAEDTVDGIVGVEDVQNLLTFKRNEPVDNSDRH